METAGVTQLKKVLRKAHLQRLRGWAKAAPAELHAASERLCDHLYSYLQLRHHHCFAAPAPSHPACSSSFPSCSSPSSTAPPLYIFAYLPLYYEVDLVPLMRRLWSTPALHDVHVLTPVVLPHSADAADPLRRAMAFVEVFDAADLDNAFAPQGAFHIREFSTALLRPWLLGPTAEAERELTTTATAVAVHGSAPDHQQQEATEREKRDEGEGRVRRLVLCDHYSTLFPAAHAAGYRPSGLVDYAEEASGVEVEKSVPRASERELLRLTDVSMLVLAPGVLFDVQTGRRIGKGCGYYDRFLSFHARHRLGGVSAASSTAGELAEPCASTSHRHFEVMAVAFDSQVLRSQASSAAGAEGGDAEAALGGIPVAEHDEPVDAVVSPSGGVEIVHHRCS